MGEHKNNPRAVGSDVPAVLELFGRPLFQGDRVMVTSGQPTIFTVVDLKPDLRPHASPGQVLMTLQATVTLPVFVGRRIANLLRVVSVVELQDGEQPDTAPEKKTTITLTDEPANGGGKVQ